MTKTIRTHAASQLPYWIAGILTGLVSCGYAWAFKQMASLSFEFFHTHFYAWAAFVPIGFFCSFFLVKNFAPGAAGSGIPQVMAAIQRKDESHTWLQSILGLKVILIKIISSLASVSVGGAIGREGPTIQIGASIFNYAHRFIPKTSADSSKKQKALILAGGAAGIAAAFNTPLGGIVFAIEELATDAFKEFRTTLLMGVIIAGMSAQWIMGSYLYLGSPSPQQTNFYSTFASIIVSIFAGAAGGLFGTTLFSLNQLRLRMNTRKKQILWIATISLVFIVLAFLTDGKTLGPGTEAITESLKNPQHGEFWEPITRFFSTQASYLSGGAGGIFAPSLSIGASMGSWANHLFFDNESFNSVLIIVGMISFLTGITHAPLTSLVLVMEMVDQPMITLPMMLGSLIAYTVTKALKEKSFYERMSEIYLAQS